MLDWIDLVLEPYIAQAPEGIVPVLFLDSYRAHMMKSVVTRIQALPHKIVSRFCLYA